MHDLYHMTCSKSRIYRFVSWGGHGPSLYGKSGLRLGIPSRFCTRFRLFFRLYLTFLAQYTHVCSGVPIGSMRWACRTCFRAQADRDLKYYTSIISSNPSVFRRYVTLGPAKTRRVSAHTSWSRARRAKTFLAFHRYISLVDSHFGYSVLFPIVPIHSPSVKDACCTATILISKVYQRVREKRFRSSLPNKVAS